MTKSRTHITELFSGYLKLAGLVCLVVASVGCGKKEDKKLELNEFAGYVQAFEEASVSQGMAIKVDNLIVRFTEFADSRDNGNCTIVENETPQINIDRTNWQSMSDDKRTSLLMHELGHCVLFRQHKSGIDQDGYPVSLMNPYTVNGQYLRAKYEAYINELFHPSA